MLVHKKTLCQIQSNPGWNLTILRGIRTWELCAAEHLGRAASTSFSPLKTKNGEHENAVKQLKQVQTLHHISQSCCQSESHQAGSHVQHLESLKNIKTSENILKYTNFISRNVILNFYKIDIHSLFTLNDRPFVPAAPVKFHTTSINQSTLFKHGKCLSKLVFRHAV